MHYVSTIRLSTAVSVSGRPLRDDHFVRDVEHASNAAGLPGTKLVLELTESTVIDQPEKILDRLNALKQLGVRLAIDDFGTRCSAQTA